MRLRATLLRPSGGLRPLASIIKGFFANGEQGVWYDPSDLSTLYQDAAGTIPVTAVEQPVGRILDKSGRGNHASQITATSRPVLSARVNLLTKTEDFAHSDWAWGNKLTYEAASAPNGENTATKLTTAADVIATRFFTAVATSFEYVIYLKTGAGFTPAALVRNITTALNLINVRTTDVSGSNQYGSWDVISLDGGWKKIKITVTGGISTGNGLVFYFGNTGLVPIGSYWYIWHPDIRPANTSTNLPDYQRVNTATDYDTAGFPRIEWFDAVDDVQNVTFPVSLGSNCTVARVAQGGAVTILTGQTIGTSYQINQSHAGLIVVNRALTQSETSAVTRYLQRKGIGQ